MLLCDLVSLMPFNLEDFTGILDKAGISITHFKSLANAGYSLNKEIYICDRFLN